MSVRSSIPFAAARPMPPQVPSLLCMPTPVLEFMGLLREKSTYPSALHKAMYVAGRCFADAQDYGAAELMVYWQNVIRLQHYLLQHQRLPSQGRPPGQFRETDEELDYAIREGFWALREYGESVRTITQGKLLQAMGRSGEDTKRVREMWKRLGFPCWAAMKRHYFYQSP
jgi:hypothetical protein